MFWNETAFSLYYYYYYYYYYKPSHHQHKDSSYVVVYNVVYLQNIDCSVRCSLSLSLFNVFQNNNKPSRRVAAWWLVPATADNDERGSGQSGRPSVSSLHRQPPLLLVPLTPPSCGRCDDGGRCLPWSTNGVAVVWQRQPVTRGIAILLYRLL